MEGKEENEVMEVVDLTEQQALPGLGFQLDEAMKNVWKAMHPVCLLHSADFRELLKEHEPRHGESLMDCVDLVLSNKPYYVRSGREDVNARCDIFNSKDMSDSVALCRRMMRREPHEQLFCTTLQLRQLFKMQPRARKDQ